MNPLRVPSPTPKPSRSQRHECSQEIPLVLQICRKPDDSRCPRHHYDRRVRTALQIAFLRASCSGEPTKDGRLRSVRLRLGWRRGVGRSAAAAIARGRLAGSLMSRRDRLTVAEPLRLRRGCLSRWGPQGFHFSPLRRPEGWAPPATSDAPTSGAASSFEEVCHVLRIETS